MLRAKKSTAMRPD
jgi:hypothetical protein